jgi:hypothetical protein
MCLGMYCEIVDFKSLNYFLKLLILYNQTFVLYPVVVRKALLLFFSIRVQASEQIKAVVYDLNAL